MERSHEALAFMAAPFDSQSSNVTQQANSKTTASYTKEEDCTGFNYGVVCTDKVTRPL
ncbi:hypothetical protein Pta6605_46880 [Pseudomonas amygdali pv. tabaci]|nr:hypothetical protein Pta6605_46880 [Pseudomonas amygdali pv. tabaci]